MICNICNEDKVETNFYKNYRFCKICYRNKRIIHRQKNKEEISKRRREHYRKNRDLILLKNRLHWELNKEECRKKRMIYYQKNRDKVCKRRNLYRQKNAAKFNEQERLRRKQWSPERKERIKKQKQLYCIANKSKIDEKKKLYAIKNKEKIREYQLKYRKNKVNMERLAKSRREKYHSDLNYKINKLISIEIRKTIKKNKQKNYCFNKLDYTIPQLINHIESKFNNGMNWNEFKNGNIHIDHIIPKSAFDFENNPDLIRICWSLDNLQPLWRDENLKKADKLPNGIKAKLLENKIKTVEDYNNMKKLLE